MQPAILTEKLTKTYGRRLGIQNLDLEVRPGEVFGFIGPNGAGKTTTIRLLLDLLHPASGRAALAALWPFCMLFGALSLLISALVRRNVFAITIPAVILVATYVINGLSEATQSMRPLRYASLLYYIGHPLQGDFPWAAVLGVMAGTCVLVALAVTAFARRDVFT